MADKGSKHQTGYADLDQLRRTLKTSYPDGNELKLDDFISVEELLTLALEVGDPNIDVTKADRLLANYPLLRPSTFGKQEHLMQMARRNLLKLSSSTTWRKCLHFYSDDSLEHLRQFDIKDNQAVPRDDPFGGTDRRPLYLERLLSNPGSQQETSFAKPGKSYSYYAKFEAPDEGTSNKAAPGEQRQVSIPDALQITNCEIPFPQHRAQREDITVSLEELIAAAKVIGERTGATHYASVLTQIFEQNLFKELVGSDVRPCDRILLSKVKSLVGLVGAGKSVLTNTLLFVLAQRGCKVVSLLNSVSDVMDTTAFLRSAGISASPLVSNRDRLTRLNEIFDQDASMLLDDSAARYLETPCLIDGLSGCTAQACSYDTVPCHTLKSSNGKDSRIICPYWDICPSRSMARESKTSNVVIATPAAFSLTLVGRERKPLFELALADFDIVFFDEADRVQAQLDSIFAPDMKFEELVYHSADPTAAAMKRPPKEKMRDLNEENFYDLRQMTEPVAKALFLSVKQGDVRDWKVVANEAFTSLTLLNDLKESLPPSVHSELEERINGCQDNDETLNLAIKISCQPGMGEIFQMQLAQYLEKHDFVPNDPTRRHLSFLLKVISFDEFLRDLATASDYLAYKDESMSELYSFLRFSYVRQQRYLPSSPVGNLFGMRLDEGNDLILFRQFAFGRAFMDSLPWLDTDEEGHPTGPHVLLLSGSSYEPGCLQYHVNRPVDYLLEAQPWISDKLSSSLIADLGIEQNVSGSGAKHRSQNLSIVLSQLMSTICLELEHTDSKILMIVNSYLEAETARESVETFLRRQSNAEKVCALTKNIPEDKERFIPRSEVYRFASHPARILIAPAMAIERGFNIVDSTGHATFGSLIFCVRPMGTPRDIGVRYRRLNGLLESKVATFPDNPAQFSMKIRSEAWRLWKGLEQSEGTPLSILSLTKDDVLIRDTISTLMVTLVQIFGRLARLRDPKRPAPHVYFADAAFRGSHSSFKTLQELGNYLQDLIENSEQPAVAKALYGPFYNAFKKGIK